MKLIMCLLTQCQMCNLDTVIPAEMEDDKNESVNRC